MVLLVVLRRLRYKPSLRDLAELFLPRGVVFTHEAVRDGEARFAPLVADRLRAKRRGQAGASWYVMNPLSRSTVDGAPAPAPSTGTATWSTPG